MWPILWTAVHNSKSKDWEPNYRSEFLGSGFYNSSSELNSDPKPQEVSRDSACKNLNGVEKENSPINFPYLDHLRPKNRSQTFFRMILPDTTWYDLQPALKPGYTQFT
jgi:hypothetical protein